MSEEAAAPVPRPPRARPAVRLLEPDDVAEAVLTLSRAFFLDPVISWLLRKDALRSTGLTLFFTIAIQRMYLQHRLCYATEDMRGVVLWQPPGSAIGMPVSAWLSRLSALPLIFGYTGLIRALRVGMAVDGAHPDPRKRPHYYLGVIGVDPAFQGRSYASALVQPVLDRADSEGVGCYLENSNPRNTALYERWGFRGTGLIRLHDPNAPPLLAMWREPRTREGVASAAT
jgi:ribosomal protein S18 acetylase RimI-like enzyme